MEAEEAAVGLGFGMGGEHGVDGAGQDLGRVGDHGGQDADGAEAAMRGGHAVQRLRRLVVVQERVAAAVHLQVEEARRERAGDAADRGGGGEACGFGEGEAASARDAERRAGPEPGAVPDRVGEEPEVGGGAHDRGPALKK
jgi:hypothetical protein